MRLGQTRPAFGPSLFAPDSCVWMRVEIADAERDLIREEVEGLTARVSEVCRRSGLSEPPSSEFPPDGVERFLYLAGHFACAVSEREGRKVEGPWVRTSSDAHSLSLALGLPRRWAWGRMLELGWRLLLESAPENVRALLPEAHRLRLESDESYLAARKKSGGLEKESVQLDLFELAARRRGLPVMRLSTFGVGWQHLQIGFGRGCRLMMGSYTDETSHVGSRLVHNKEMTRQLLAGLGVPMPAQRKARSAEQAVMAAEAIGYPVVVKPNTGGKGVGVFTRIGNASQVREAFDGAQKGNQRVGGPALVESFVEGLDHRVVVCKGRYLYTILRLPARVIGDGRHTVRELVEFENRNPHRGDGHATHMKRLALDAIGLEVLKRQGLDPDSIVEEGRVAMLRFIANYSAGGTMEDVTDRIHPDNVALALHIAAEVGVDLVGIDLVGDDISTSYREGRLKVIEVNAGPGLQGPPTKNGGFRDLAGEVMDELMPPDQRQHLPIVLIVRAEGGVSVAGKVARHWERTRGTIGVSADGVVRVGDIGTEDALEVVDGDPVFGLLRSRQVAGIVVERSLSDIALHGLGTGGCDLVVWAPGGAVSCASQTGEGEEEAENVDEEVTFRLLEKEARLGMVMIGDPPYVSPLAIKGLSRPEATTLVFADHPADEGVFREPLDAGASVCRLDRHSGEIRWRSGTSEGSETGVLGTRENLFERTEDQAGDPLGVAAELLAVATLRRLEESGYRNGRSAAKAVSPVSVT